MGEKEEQESEQEEKKAEEPAEEKKVEADNKESNNEAPEEDKEDDGKEGDEDGKEVRARKKFKMPKVELKAPKVPDFIRSLSKERKKVSTLKAFVYQCTKIKL